MVIRCLPDVVCGGVFSRTSLLAGSYTGHHPRVEKRFVRVEIVVR